MNSLSSKQDQELIRRLSSRDPAVRNEAISSIKQSGLRGHLGLANLARAHLYGPTVRISRKKALCTDVVSTAALIFFLCTLFFTLHPVPVFMRYFVLVSWVFAIIGNAVRQWPKLRLRYSLVESLIMANDLYLIGPLIGCIGLDEASLLSWPRLFSKAVGRKPEIAAHISEAVIHLIDRLDPSGYVDITILERSILLEALGSNSSELVLALLRLLERIGDNRELPTVKALKNGKYGAATNTAVREVAARCGAVIEARLAEKAQPGTLLRASQPTGQDDTLVRPVTNVPDEQAVLLRAAQGED